jgi:hypothetical protein
MKQDHNLRIRPRDDVYLDRKRGIAGEIFFDKTSNSLRCYDGGTPGGFELARSDLENIPTEAFNEKLSASNAVVTTEAYVNPSWIVSIDASKITGLNTGGGEDGGVPANIVLTSDVGTVTNTMLAGSIANNKLLNSSLTIGTTAFSLGSSSTTLAGLTSVTSTSFNGPLTGSVTGSVTGNASSASTLQTARTINGVSFNGSANITVTAAAATLTGTALNSTVVTSSLTSVGTLNTLTVTGLVTANDEITAVGDITTDANVVVAQSPSLITHATNKQYVDARSVAMAVALS